MYDEDSFYAINKMVDFAKSGAAQKQMIASMNDTIAAMRIPGVDNPMPGTVNQTETKEEKPNEN